MKAPKVFVPERKEIKTILVDVDASLLKKAKKILENQNDRITVETVKTAKKALKLIKSGDYDAVISDYETSDTDSFEFLKHLRSEDISIQFIVFTANGSEKVAMKSLNLGADQYVRKVGNPKSKFSKIADIIVKESEGQREEEAMNLRMSLFASLLKNIPDTVYFKNRDGRFLLVSETKAEEVGVKIENILGKKDSDFYSDDAAEEREKDEQKVMEEEESVVNKIEKVTTSNGEKRWVSTTKVPYYDEQGNVMGVLGISRDLTEHWVLWRRMKNRRKG